jgi:hypothetical protein
MVARPGRSSARRPPRARRSRGAAAIAITLAGLLWSHAIPTGSAALDRLSDPATFGALTAGLVAVAALAARGAVGDS